MCHPASCASWSVRTRIPLELANAPHGMVVHELVAESSKTAPDLRSAPAVGITPSAVASVVASEERDDERSASHNNTGGSSASCSRT